MLLLYFIAAGVIVGRLRGGRLSALASVRFRWWGLALAGLGFQLVLFSRPVAERVGDAGPALYVASSLAVFVAMLRNLGLPGFPLIAIGAALNLTVIVANGGYMPSSPDAWLQLTGLAALPTTGYSNSALIGAVTPLPFLGDIFVLPRPLPFANVFSVGDVLIGVGAAWCLVRSMTVTAAGRGADDGKVAGGPARVAADPGKVAAGGPARVAADPGKVAADPSVRAR